MKRIHRIEWCEKIGKYLETKSDSDTVWDTVWKFIPFGSFVPVIRCKDCRHTEVITPEYIVCEIDMRKITDESFCSWAERREE